MKEPTRTSFGIGAIVKMALAFCLVMAAAIYMTVSHTSKVFASGCVWESTYCGYFSQSPAQCNSDIAGCYDVLPRVQSCTFSGGSDSPNAICATNVTDLENELTGYVNTFCTASNASSQQRWEGVGAAFIMADMVEGSDDSGQTACDAVYHDSKPCDYDSNIKMSSENCWVKALNYYNSQGAIDYNTTSYSFTYNTFADQDNATYRYDVSLYEGQGTGVTPAIIFYKIGTPHTPQNVAYIIKHLCGNPVGNLALLPGPIPHPNEVTISGTIYAYNGNSFQPIETNIFTCSAAGTISSNKNSLYSTRSHPGGRFSFEISNNPTTEFCIRITYGNTTGTYSLPPGGGDTAYIIPSQLGPPISPQPNCLGHTDRYEEQYADGIGNCALDGGFNIVIEPSVPVSCSISNNTSPSPLVLPLTASSSDEVKLTVVPGRWSTWGFGTPAVNASASLSWTSTSLNLNQNPSGSATYVNTLTSASNPALPASSGSYNVVGNMSGPFVSSSTACSSPLTLVYEPYFEVNGGDVFSGVDSQYPESCYDDRLDGGIYGWNNGSTGANNLGAGTSSAALATNSINGFVSGQGMFSIPDPLTFANFSTNGYFQTYNSSSSSCGNTYYESIESEASHPCTFPASGTLTLSAGQTYICYTNGNITINSNITYNLSGANASNLPLVMVVANGGNITIGSNVSTLAGTFVAENGNIYDTTGGLVTEPVAGDNSTNTGGSDRLVVDGTFIAKKLYLYRTYGTLNDPTSLTPFPDAEEFDYSPINWLAPSSPTTLKTVSITSLPPVF